MSPVEIVVWVASVVSAIAVLAGAVWWLVWPRVEDKLEQISKQVRGVDTQLSSDDPDTISRYARVAAGAASQLPGIHERLSEVAATQVAIEEWRTSFERRPSGLTSRSPARWRRRTTVR